MNTATKTTKTAAKASSEIKVFWINIGYYSQETFSTVEEALVYVRRCFFEARLERNGEMLGAWTIFGGYRTF